MLFRQLNRALFPDIQVSCKDTAPWFIVALLSLSLHVVTFKCLLKVLGSIQKQDVPPLPPVGVMKLIAGLRIMEFALK